MSFLRRYGYWLFLFCFVAGLISAPPAANTARTRVADGFDFPVGKPDAENYYKSRGFRARYHMGEDWNGIEGGNGDLGKPVYSIANGYVVMARDLRRNWGNLVIIRHIYLDSGELKTADSVYAHLDSIMIREGQQVVRGQQVGTIGTNRGMYPAHLHFEIRKNLKIGYNESGFPKDLTNYYLPSPFILARRKLPGGGRSALVEIDTFMMPNQPPSATTTQQKKTSISETILKTPTPSPKRQESFKVNRFDDMKSF